MLDESVIKYPSKGFFKTGKKIVWSGEKYVIRFENPKIIEVIRNGLPFLCEKNDGDIKLFDILKLFLYTPNFMVLYYYSIGNGYTAEFDFVANKVFLSGRNE